MGLRPCWRNQRASLAAAVVLPDPCSPASRIDRRRLRSETELQGLAAERPSQLLVYGLHDLLARGEALRQSRPRRSAALMPSIRPRATATSTSASSRAGADLAKGLIELGV